MRRSPTLHLLAVASLLTVLAAALASPATARDKLVAFTSHLPPLSLNSEDKGIAVEMMERIAELAGLEIEVVFVPWKRAQLLVQETPGAVLFSIGRSDLREDKYHWITELLETESGFVTKGPRIDSFSAAAVANTLTGVLLGSGRVPILRENGVTNLDEVPSEEDIAEMLHAGRVEAWYTMLWRAAYLSRKLGFSTRDLTYGRPVWTGRQYVAASPDFDKDMSKRIRQAAVELRGSPEYQQIISRYVHGIN